MTSTYLDFAYFCLLGGGGGTRPGRRPRRLPGGAPGVPWGVFGQMGVGAGRPYPKSIPSVPAAHGREKDWMAQQI